MERFTGFIGIFIILGLAFLFSNNRKAINYKLVASGLLLQSILAVFILKVPLGQIIFKKLADFINLVLDFSDKGAAFVFGPLMRKELLVKAFGEGNDFVFVFKVLPAIIFITSLVSILYHYGIIQKIISVVARVVHKLMHVSGSEALSNISSVFVGQVEAQILIKHYVPTMTKSELLASMSGSLACIAGGVMAVYIGLGIPAEYLLTASAMAIPGALVISKIIYPETEESKTKDSIRLEVEKHTVNFVDAIAHGASEGLKVALNVVAMIISFIAIVKMFDYFIGCAGTAFAGMGVSLGFIGLDINSLSLKDIFGSIFSLVAWTMGVPWSDAHIVGSLMGTKLVINEFVAYLDLMPIINGSAGIVLSEKSILIATFALCGFANFGSVAVLVGGIGQLAPDRRHDIAKLGFKALLCGTMASYLSATIAGILGSF